MNRNYNQMNNFNPSNYNSNMNSINPNMNPINPNSYNQTDDRLIGGGFAFPFLLGGVTGAAIAPAFWRPNNNPYYYRPYPYYPPYYR